MSNPQKSSRWGSFLSQAVAGVEARLDNILAEEDAPKQTQPQSQPPQPDSTLSPASPPARSPTPSRAANDRLQERLARAVAAKSAAQKSDVSARPSAEFTSPTSSPRPSSDLSRSEPAAPTRTRQSQEAPGSRENPPAIAPIPLSDQGGNATTSVVSNGHMSATASARSSLQSERVPQSQAANWEPALLSSKTPTPMPVTEEPSSPHSSNEQRIAELEKAIQEAQTQHQEELHEHVERVDALQAKLQYLAREATQTARSTASAAPPGTLEKKVAEKDEQIAQLMDEGQKLASTEQKHRSIIKKLRGQLAVVEKELNEQKTSRQKYESEVAGLRRRINDLSELEKAEDSARNIVIQLRKDLDKLKEELASRDSAISELKSQLQEESEKNQSMASKVNEELREAGQQRVKELEDTIATLEVEKGLVTDRAKAQAAELREKADRAAEKARTVELELKGEVQILESKLETLRARAEEASSGAVGDAQAKLLRQIETLQTQYSIASENWQGMEASLMARTANLEKERDEALRRESEMRRKARETASRAKRQEEELEEAKNQLPSVQRDLSSYQSQFDSLRKRAEEAENALAEARADFESQQAAWKEEKEEKEEKEKTERADNDRRSWLDEIPTAAFRNTSRPESPLLSAVQRTFSGDNFLGLQNYPARFRKPSAPSSNGDPSPGDRPSSARRPSAQPPIRSPSFPAPIVRSPSFPAPVVRSGTPPSMPTGLEMLASPPAHPVDREDVFEGMERSASPQNVLQDMVSVSTTAAGPSVQLVERMSAAIRRLESEKVAAKEELSRISRQRDEARGEIVSLIKEVDTGKGAAKRVEDLEKEVGEINERYQTTLEMLGEKSELVEELRADVQDVKAMYRDLVERTIK
ncbi:hypothetical protein F5Y15DRAFT_418939 [Xylariaceae sp. FL0016]|nr:hypothetical protein F5Y15DRAFT_418939 [Xylariaceae sp. FL0016]